MRDEYDFSKKQKSKATKKAKDLKVIKTFRLDPEILMWLETEGEKNGMGYQTFLNWFLKQSMKNTKNFEERLQRLEKIVLKK